VEEIIDQVLAVERWNADESKVQSLKSKVQSQGAGAGSQNPESGIQNHASPNPQPSTPSPQPRLVSNLVIMGMGEPLAEDHHFDERSGAANPQAGG
jgi:adenine C2-methylase RlmN of 23S rRNA A2503 and tRNA A37